MASLHLGNQFMYHMIISGIYWAFFFNVFFIYSSSPLTAVRRDEDKKWNKTLDRPWNLCSLLTKFIGSRRLDINIGLFLRFYGPRLCLGPWKRNKRTQPISSHLDLTSLTLSISHMNIFRADPYKSGKGRQYKKSLHFRTRNLSNV